MGWKGPGTGLGANQDGIATHLSVQIKENNKGLGCDVSTDDKAWVVTSTEYSNVLQNLQSALLVKEAKKSSLNESKEKKHKDKKEKKEKRKGKSTVENDSKTDRKKEKKMQKKKERPNHRPKSDRKN